MTRVELNDYIEETQQALGFLKCYEHKLTKEEADQLRRSIQDVRHKLADYVRRTR